MSEAVNLSDSSVHSLLAQADGDISSYMRLAGEATRTASYAIAKASTAQKSRALQAIASALEANVADILAANEVDMRQASINKIDQPLIDRLKVTEKSVAQMAAGVREVDALPDPVGAVSDMNSRPSGIQVGRMRVPLGVIGIIYESRPNVTVDAAVLCLKSGNAALLRGGSEAFESNRAIAACIAQGLAEAQLPAATVHLLETTDRAAVGALLKLDDCIDVIVPRGGKGLIERIMAESRIPVIKHLDGICHVYIDGAADPDMAVQIAVNSKTEKLAVCCAMETLLIDATVAEQLLPKLAQEYAQAGVELRGCVQTCAILPQIVAATEADWGEEYLGPVLSIRVVAGLDEAIAHINRYSSAHTDTIVTNDYSASQRFLREVDSASVLINASTQFADGFEFGLGAEIGISTDKLHARGPVGLEGLTTQKYIVLGQGEIRHR